jgi:hypothetical protein
MACSYRTWTWPDSRVAARERLALASPLEDARVKPSAAFRLEPDGAPVQLITATEPVSASAGLFNTARSVWAHQMKSIQVNSFLAVIDLRRRRRLWCRRNRWRARLNWRLSCLR